MEKQFYYRESSGELKHRQEIIETELIGVLNYINSLSQDIKDQIAHGEFDYADDLVARLKRYVNHTEESLNNLKNTQISRYHAEEYEHQHNFNSSGKPRSL